MTARLIDALCMPGAEGTRSCLSVSISPVRLLIYGIYCVALAATFPFFVERLAHPDYLLSLVLTYVLAALIPLCAIFGRRIDFVEPIYWFSAKYYLVVPGALYFLVTGFAYSEHLLNPGVPKLTGLVEKSLALFIVGYVSYLLGYLLLMQNRGKRAIRLPESRNMAGWIARLAIMACLFFGIGNFLYLLMSYPGGPLGYLLDFGQRGNRFDDIAGPVTTIGYQFLYAGVFLWYVLLIRDRTLGMRHPEAYLFALTVLLSIIVSISQGRLSQSISYVLIIFSLSYIFSVRGSQNLRFVTFAGVGLVGGIVLYFFRRVSAGTFGSTDTMTVEALVKSVNDFAPALGYWLVDKGNVPNLAVVINLVDQNGLAGHYWYGASIPIALSKISGYLGDLPNIGETAALVWFNGGGGLPPTIVGEMFVNFGVIGVPAGLFIVGLLSAWFYGRVRKNGHFLLYIVYVAILFKFFFLWPKGEISNIVGAFWQFVPTVLVYCMIRAVSRTSTLQRFNKFPQNPGPELHDEPKTHNATGPTKNPG